MGTLSAGSGLQELLASIPPETLAAIMAKIQGGEATKPPPASAAASAAPVEATAPTTTAAPLDNPPAETPDPGAVLKALMAKGAGNAGSVP